jgi:hypothetical protein
MIHLVTVVGSRLDLLPHMLRYYRGIGITSLLVNLHLDTYQSPLFHKACAICKTFGATIDGVFIGKWLQGVNPFLYWQTRRQHLDDWFILADVDEFQAYPRDVRLFLSDMDKQGYDYVQGCLLDRIGRDGTFPSVAEDMPVWEQYPLAGLVTYRILKANILKIVAAKGYVRLAPGQHGAVNGTGCPVEQECIQVHHFKWSSDVVTRLEHRVDLYTAFNEVIWPESQRFIEYYRATGGRIDVDDPELLLVESALEYPHWNTVKEMISEQLRRYKRMEAL